MSSPREHQDIPAEQSVVDPDSDVNNSDSKIGLRKSLIVRSSSTVVDDKTKSSRRQSVRVRRKRRKTPGASRESQTLMLPSQKKRRNRSVESASHVKTASE